MSSISRERLQFIEDSDVGVGADEKFTPIVPVGESWQITRITFGDMSKNDTKSGSFKVEFGGDVLAIAYVSGGTIVIDVNRVFVGDGVKRFSMIRESQSNPAKKMLIFMEGFKRIGG